ncbi:MAG: 50S ribosomal protein L9 [Thiotrichales bacterium]|nr:50S ribosomal protein L9 [Thiotrichales bacterium]
MEVILLEKIHKLGELGEQVRVKPGYGRNYLIPQGKAVPATEENIKVFEERRAELEKAQAEALQEAQAQADKLDGQSFTIRRRASSEGKLFGSVSVADIEQAITEAGLEASKQGIHLPDGPFRAVGEYELVIEFPADVSAGIRVIVEAEEQEETESQ